MSMTTVVSPSSSREPEQAPPASCHEGDFPRTLNLIWGRLSRRQAWGCGKAYAAVTRSVRKTKASWRSGARLRSAGRNVEQGSDRFRAQRWFWRKKQSSQQTRLPLILAPFGICIHPASGGVAPSTHEAAKRSIFDNLQSPAFSADGPQLPGFRTGRISSRRVDLVTGATGYVGGRLA